MMKKKYDYFAARVLVKITAIVFVTQLVFEISGIINRKPGFEWVIYACGSAFIASILYALTLVVLNARKHA